ncbi:MAG: guanylate kinase [Chlamydiales bacterium]|jgi:guanylate kinase|nr:guanylate kinase [Chlamydiales bacterium]
MSQPVLSNCLKGFVFVLSAPAGTGKTTLVRMLSNEFDSVVESISYTTRPPRSNEIDGKDYFFISEKKFESKIKKGDFLEYAKVFGYNYGTSCEYVHSQQERGKHVFLVIDTQGAIQLKEKNFVAIYIFLSPPSLEVLESRLLSRKTENKKTLARRLSWAEKELKKINYYDYHIVNDSLEHAYTILRSIIVAEEHRVRQLST